MVDRHPTITVSLVPFCLDKYCAIQSVTKVSDSIEVAEINGYDPGCFIPTTHATRKIQADKIPVHNTCKIV